MMFTGKRGLKLSGVLLAVLMLSLVFHPFLSAAEEKASKIPPQTWTVYALSNIYCSGTFDILAYDIVVNDIVLADSWPAVCRDAGPVGLAVDETNENLFVSYEGGNTIQIYNARDATPLGSILLVGTSDLAGMVVHQQRGHLYVVDRGRRNVYVYDSTTFVQQSTWMLPTGNGAWGIDLLGDVLYVADRSSTIRWYDIDSHTQLGSVTQTHPAIAVAVTDYPEELIYSTAFSGTSSLSQYLTKKYVASGLEETQMMGGDVKGVSLNPVLELAYVVADNRIHVVDTNLMSVIKTEQLNAAWVPTDILASYIPFGGLLKKSCESHPNGKFYKGDEITFKLSFQNRHTRPIHILPVKDTYDTAQLTFLSSDPPTDDTVNDGVIDWSNLVTHLGADLAVGEWTDILVKFQVVEDCYDELEGTNMAEIYNVQDDQGTPLIDSQSIFNYQIECKCRSDVDCDDGIFCNGHDMCQEDGTCVSPGNPCPLDDGLWCNGTETDECDEDMDQCVHVKPPCVDDEYWCNGEEICNENTDSCSNSEQPCVDDGEFCNGEETCNEETKDCASSGDPCQPTEECNESTDSCDAVELDDDDDATDSDDTENWPEGKVTGGCCGC